MPGKPLDLPFYILNSQFAIRQIGFELALFFRALQAGLLP